jgi:hypothetical protein
MQLGLHPSNLPELETELLATKGTALSKRTASSEWIASAKWSSVERIATLLFVIIWIIALIVSSLQLRIAQYLICFINGPHLLLRLFLGDSLFVRLVGVVCLDHFPIGCFDL